MGKQPVSILIELTKDLIDMTDLLSRNVQLMRHQVHQGILQMTLSHISLQSKEDTSYSTSSENTRDGA